RISAPKPTPLFPTRDETMSSRPPKAPPQMKRMFVVSSWMNSWCGCLRPPCGGTAATVPSRILRRACCTPSRDTSRVIDGFSALRRGGGHGSPEDREEGRRHAFTRHVPRYRPVLRLAGHLVDLVDVDDRQLAPVDVVIGRLEQLQQDVLAVLTDLARLGETGGV